MTLILEICKLTESKFIPITIECKGRMRDIAFRLMPKEGIAFDEIQLWEIFKPLGKGMQLTGLEANHIVQRILEENVLLLEYMHAARDALRKIPPLLDKITDPSPLPQQGSPLPSTP